MNVSVFDNIGDFHLDFKQIWLVPAKVFIDEFGNEKKVLYKINLKHSNQIGSDYIE